MNLCNSFWLLRDFEDRGNCFVVNGLTQMGELRQKTRRRAENLMTRERVFGRILSAIYFFYLVFELLRLIWLDYFA